MVACAENVYCTTLLERQIKSLRRSDKKGAAAATRAEELMSAIARGQLSDKELLTKQTKNGELRLKNCRKFDLGSGYRLISLRDTKGLYFAFLGTHDASDRWLNKRQTAGLCQNPKQIKPLKDDLTVVETNDLPTELLQAEAEYETYIASKLDEATIRYLFRGLRGKTASSE